MWVLPLKTIFILKKVISGCPCGRPRTNKSKTIFSIYVVCFVLDCPFSAQFLMLNYTFFGFKNWLVKMLHFVHFVNVVFFLEVGGSKASF